MELNSLFLFEILRVLLQCAKVCLVISSESIQKNNLLIKFVTIYNLRIKDTKTTSATDISELRALELTIIVFRP